MTALTLARLDWQTDDEGNDVPVSCQFDDVYFSKKNGLLESHYVFLKHNDLPRRFATLFQGNTNRQRFVIAETGFGTGLNFLATCALWYQVSQEYKVLSQHPPILHFISTEKYPLAFDDLAKSLTVWKDTPIAPFVSALLDHYPLPIKGCHRRHIAAELGVTIVLDLWLGDALESLRELVHGTKEQNQLKQRQIDAWFLDGFAPSKNNELWSDELFDVIATLSKPTTTLATFTSAGSVRRQLCRIGATPAKVKGFGCKREMLTAHFANTDITTNTAPLKAKLTTVPHSAIVVGAGIAGLFTAYSLANRGVQVTLLDKSHPLAGASGNPRAFFSPKLSAIEHAKSHLPTVSFLYAHHQYRRLNDHAGTAIFEQTGALDFMLPNQRSSDKLAKLIQSYPNSLIHKTNTHTSINQNLSFCAYSPMAGLIHPSLLCQHILSHPLIATKQATVSHILYNDNQAIAYDTGTPIICADIAVICAGFESHLIDPTIYDCRKIRGQLSWITTNSQTKSVIDQPSAVTTATDVSSFNNPATTPLSNAQTIAYDFLSTFHHSAIKYDGYVCVADNTVLFGASFIRNDTQTDIRSSEHLFNLQKLTAALPACSHILKDAPLSGRASIRSQTPDYHPIVGQLSCGIYACTAMGSKGFSFSPLCGEIVAGLALNEPLPITNELLTKITPHRKRLATPINQYA